MRSVGADRASGIVLLLFAALVVWESRALPLGGFDSPGPGALPVGLAVILGGLGALVAWRGGGLALGAVRWPETPSALGILGAAAFAALAIEPLGYRLTIFAAVAFLLRVLERKGWMATGIAALGLAEGTYWLFAQLLRTPLPIGPFGF